MLNNLINCVDPRERHNQISADLRNKNDEIHCGGSSGGYDWSVDLAADSFSLVCSVLVNKPPGSSIKIAFVSTKLKYKNKIITIRLLFP